MYITKNNLTTIMLRHTYILKRENTGFKRVCSNKCKPFGKGVGAGVDGLLFYIASQREGRNQQQAGHIDIVTHDFIFKCNCEKHNVSECVYTLDNMHKQCISMHDKCVNYVSECISKPARGLFSNDAFENPNGNVYFTLCSLLYCFINKEIVGAFCKDYRAFV